MIKRLTLSLGLLALGVLSAHHPLLAQTLDPTMQSFVPKISGSYSIPLAWGHAVQPDGKVLVGGGFDFVNGSFGGKLRRFNADGTVDATFNPGGLGPHGFVQVVTMQPDGKILIAGGFTAYNGVPVGLFTRLNANGTLDTSFNPGGRGVNYQITTIAVQPDGKILLGGVFSEYNGQPAGAIVRLNADGTRDATFTATGTSNPQSTGVRSLVVQPDGKILVGGAFTEFNGQAAGGLVRLTTTGALDTGFATGQSSAGATVSALVLQPNGAIVAGGSFTQLNGLSVRYLTRLLADGSLDPAFQPGTGPNNSVSSIYRQSTGDLLLGGSFTQYNGTARGRLARISASGQLDAQFAAGTGLGTATQVTSLVTGISEVGGQPLIVGNIYAYDGSPAGGAIRLNTTTGTRDAAFAPNFEMRGTLSQVVPLATGQILISGSLTELNGQTLGPLSTATELRRLNANGSLDASLPSGLTGTIAAPQTNGSFYLLNGQPRRILASGVADNSFTPPLFTSGLRNLVAQPDGKLLLFGSFALTQGGVTYNSILRLTPSGAVDPSFQPYTVTNRTFVNVVLQPSGKLVVNYYDGNNSTDVRLLRLNADGTLDSSYAVNFTVPAGATVSYNLLGQPDGRLILANGTFTAINGQPTSFTTARLTVDGQLDNTFSGLSNYYLFRAVQADGRYYVSAVNASLAIPLAPSERYNQTLTRLNPDGSVDAAFTGVSIPGGQYVGDDVLSGVAIQPTDNKLLVYGGFRYVAGQQRIALARLTNVVAAVRTAAAPRLLQAYPNPAQVQLTLPLPSGIAGRNAELLDLQGRVVQRWTLPVQQAEAHLPLNRLAAGLYHLRVLTPKAVYQQQIAVQP